MKFKFIRWRVQNTPTVTTGEPDLTYIALFTIEGEGQDVSITHRLSSRSEENLEEECINQFKKIFNEL